jgi:hypothetical protein
MRQQLWLGRPRYRVTPRRRAGAKPEAALLDRSLNVLAAAQSNAALGEELLSLQERGMACLPGKLAGAVRGSEVHRYGIRSATAFAYLCDNRVGFLVKLCVGRHQTFQNS